MPEEQAKKLISEKFKDSARKRSKNIVKDALHTNQSQISWTYNVNNGMKYKVWMNGQSKSGVRYWHVRSKIQPVEIDDFFDIYGPTGHARMMYPGDLNGGAENVANCKCWLHYTNIAPSSLKKKGTIQINPNVNLENENATTFSANTEKKSTFSKMINRISNKFGSFKQKIRNKINGRENEDVSSGFTNFNDTSFKKQNPYNLEEVKGKWIPTIPIKKVKNKISNNHRIILEDAYSKIKNIIEDPNIEYGYARANDGKYIKLEQVSSKEVDLPKTLKKKYEKEGLFLLGHTHPAGESPLGSPKDICNYVKYKSLLGFSFNENGFFLVINRRRKVNQDRSITIYKKAKEVQQKMIDDFHEANFDNVEEAYKLKGNNEEKYNALLHEFVIPRQKDYARLYRNNLRKEGIIVIFI